MCGGDSVSYTYNRTDLGLNIQKVEVYADGQYSRTYIADTLLRPIQCCWARSPYNRPLTEHDVDVGQLTVQDNAQLNAQANQFIADRKEHIARVLQEAEEERVREEARANRGCVIF